MVVGMMIVVSGRYMWCLVMVCVVMGMMLEVGVRIRKN